MRIIILELGETHIAKCHYCGNINDVRPFGDNNELICISCAKKPEYSPMVKINILRHSNPHRIKEFQRN